MLPKYVRNTCWVSRLRFTGIGQVVKRGVHKDTLYPGVTLDTFERANMSEADVRPSGPSGSCV